MRSRVQALWRMRICSVNSDMRQTPPFVGEQSAIKTVVAEWLSAEAVAQRFATLLAKNGAHHAQIPPSSQVFGLRRQIGWKRSWVTGKVSTVSALTTSFASAFGGRQTVPRTWRSLTIIDRGKAMFKNGMRPVHPGEVLKEDYLIPLGMSTRALAN